MRTFDSIGIGESHTINEVVSGQMIDQFALLTGDTNKIHLDN
jgi:acyl dehydratase